MIVYLYRNTMKVLSNKVAVRLLCCALPEWHNFVPPEKQIWPPWNPKGTNITPGTQKAESLWCLEWGFTCRMAPFNENVISACCLTCKFHFLVQRKPSFFLFLLIKKYLKMYSASQINHRTFSVAHANWDKQQDRRMAYVIDESSTIKAPFLL